MRYIKTIRKTIFNIWLIGVLSFAIMYAGITLTMPLPFLGNIVLFIVDYGILFFAIMIFLWKMSETEGYTLGLANKFDKKKYLTSVLIGSILNLTIALLLMQIPVINFIPAILNYYFVFPSDLIFDKLNIPEVFSIYIALFIDTPILISVMFLGACSGNKYATFIRDTTKIETDSSELLETERTTTPISPKHSWRDSVNHNS